MKIVVKIGTSSLTSDDGVLRHDVVAAVADQISHAKTQGHDVVLVTSGAVALGIAGLRLDRRPTDVLSSTGIVCSWTTTVDGRVRKSI